ncbi:MAG: precorrin-6y C5,15-methyltransferase (decarboxylating) subunit CbiE, partial [Bacillota bacterium]|nr:precorrin-6y C5,15-methyltransferase (decarboxylating) subunit CbiE [Bacillota bacterium]
MRNTGQLYVVGVGMGFETLTEEAKRIIGGADLICGAPRMVAIARDHGLCKKEAVIYEEYRAERVFEKIAKNMQSEEKTDSREEVSVLLVSGDTGFYSAAHAVRMEMLKRKKEGREIVSDVIPIPGISSVSYFFAKCGLPWQDAKLISCHGREGAPVSAVRRNRLTFALTGNNTGELAETLCEYGFGELAVHIGQDLGSEKERIIHTTVA